MTGRNLEEGFSLVETLVSMAILAAMVGVFLEVFNANAQAAHKLARRREAVLLAQSLLAHATIQNGPEQLKDRGQWNGMTWRLSRKPIRKEARASAYPLEEVSIVVVEQSNGRRLTSVQTLRLAR